MGRVIDYGNHSGMVRRVCLDANILLNPVVMDWLYMFYRMGAPFEPYIADRAIEETLTIIPQLYRAKHHKQLARKKVKSVATKIERHR